MIKLVILYNNNENNINDDDNDDRNDNNQNKQIIDYDNQAAKLVND